MTYMSYLFGESFDYATLDYDINVIPSRVKEPISAISSHLNTCIRTLTPYASVGTLPALSRGMMNATASALEMTTSAIQARAMSADTTAPRAELEIEAAFLADIINGHRAALDALWDAEMEAELANNKELLRSIRVAIETLREDDRAFWAESRMADIRRRLGAGFNSQLTLGII